MALITEGQRVVLRGSGGRAAVLRFSAMALRGSETTRAEVEQRLGSALSTAMAPEVVTVHLHTLSPLRYSIHKGPRTPPDEWWRLVPLPPGVRL